MKRVCKHNKKSKFTADEDKRLRELVAIYGDKDWNIIASNMPKRNVRQCHDRWVYYLSPSVNTNQWSQYEEQCLVRYILKHGKKWTQVAKLFPGRNDIQIKNKWSSLKKKLKDMPEWTNREEVHEEPVSYFSDIVCEPVVEAKKDSKKVVDFDFSVIDEMFSPNDFEIEHYFY